MERDQLARVVREPGKVTREDIVGLKAMADRYPWFTGAHLLLAVGEHASGDVLYDDTLYRTAAHLPSREALFDLTEEAPPPVPVVAAAIVPPTGIEKSAPLAQVEAVAPPLSVPEEADALPPTIDMAPVQEPATELPHIDDALDRQILEAALSSAYDLTWQETVQAPEQALSTIPADAPPFVEAITITPPPEPALPPPLPALEPRSTVSRNSRLRFTDWLSAGSEGPVTPAPAQVVVEATSSVTEQPVLVPKPATKPVPAADTNALIDRFIQQDAPQPPVKATFYTPQQAAKRSLDDTAGLVTETLARIYEKQGNLPKAIDAYGRLALKHPEKSAYFAALQKKLEEQLKK